MESQSLSARQILQPLCAAVHVKLCQGSDPLMQRTVDAQHRPPRPHHVIRSLTTPATRLLAQ
jgi:hypothetical protein